MSFEQQVANIRANADPVALQAVLAAAPGSETVGPRESLHGLLCPKLSGPDDVRREQIVLHLVNFQAQLDCYCRRYEDLRSRGLAALSDYDIGIAYRGVGPERGLACALILAANHIACTRAQILWLMEQQARLAPPQLALF